MGHWELQRRPWRHPNPTSNDIITTKPNMAPQEASLPFPLEPKSTSDFVWKVGLSELIRTKEHAGMPINRGGRYERRLPATPFSPVALKSRTSVYCRLVNSTTAKGCQPGPQTQCGRRSQTQWSLRRSAAFIRAVGVSVWANDEDEEHEEQEEKEYRRG